MVRHSLDSCRKSSKAHLNNDLGNKKGPAQMYVQINNNVVMQDFVHVSTIADLNHVSGKNVVQDAHVSAAAWVIQNDCNIVVHSQVLANFVVVENQVVVEKIRCCGNVLLGPVLEGTSGW